MSLTSGVLILSGPPGAGKSTVSRLVAARLKRSAAVNGDDVARMIVNGGVGPTSEPAADAERQLLLRAENICALADNFSAAGFYPVLDHVVPSRRVLRAMVGWLTVRPVLFVTLAPALAVAQHRNQTRDPREYVPYDYAGLRVEMERELSDVGWWFDTSELGPEETADAVIRLAPARAVVAP